MSRLHRTASVLGLIASLSTGCDILDDLENPRTLVNLSITHHATPEAGNFPDRGADGQMRTFETDDGWTVILLKAYITTSGASLRGCDEREHAFDPYWGPLVEDMKAQDLDVQTLAGIQVEAAQFCGVTVEYGPDPTQTTGVEFGGATFYLQGGASKGDVMVPFTITSSEALRVELDVSAMEAGAPLAVQGDESFPVELTVSKTYDRFFDGIDFASASEDDLQAQVASVLALETAVSLGRVQP